MSRYDDPDSPEYREHNLGDDRMTADERAIERLEGKVARLTRELALQQAHERAQRATSESLAKELSAAHAKATRLEEALRRTLHWLQDDRLTQWPYMENGGFYDDRAEHIDWINAALRGPGGSE